MQDNLLQRLYMLMHAQQVLREHHGINIDITDPRLSQAVFGWRQQGDQVAGNTEFDPQRFYIPPEERVKYPDSGNYIRMLSPQDMPYLTTDQGSPQHLSKEPF